MSDTITQAELDATVLTQIMHRAAIFRFQYATGRTATRTSLILAS